jgi:hypothetical protein
MGYEVIEKAGLRVGLVNCLYTYPVWQINGYVICDWTMPVGTSHYYHPAGLGTFLKGIDYIQTLDALKRHWGWLEGSMSCDEDAIAYWAAKCFEKAKQATVHLLRSNPCDFHATMFRYLDTMQHVFIDDPGRLLEAYRLVDSGLAEIAEAADLNREDVCWLINSDHGMTQYWSDQTVKGGHDLSGFYCLSRPGLVRPDHRYTLSIEHLMPIILRLLGIVPRGTPLNPSLERALFAEDDDAAVQDRLRALGYL